jgi:hypothetical protein
LCETSGSVLAARHLFGEHVGTLALVTLGLCRVDLTTVTLQVF